MFIILFVLLFVLSIVVFSLMCWGWSLSSISLSISELTLMHMEVSLSSTSAQFVWLVLVVSCFITVYMSYYISSEFSVGFYSLLIGFFMGSIVVLLVASNWLVLLMGWEGLGLTSFLLINYYQSWEGYSNALVTVLTIRFGDFFMYLLLSGFLVYSYTGHSVSIITPISPVWLILVVITKSAQLPFSGWLPKAISAPTPTSALVHSSTLVTAGLVLIFNYSEVVNSKEALTLLSVLGFFTMVVGSLSALGEGSVNKIVAYSTLSQIGLAVLVCGMGYTSASYCNLIAHGFAKSLLFIQVGVLIHEASNQQCVGKWSVVSHIQASIRVQLLISLASLSGLSFYSGILSNECILELINYNNWYIILLLSVCLSIYITLIYSYLIYSFLYMSSSCPIGVHQGSLIALTATFFEGVLAICYFSWLGGNVLEFPNTPQGIEVSIPLLILVVLGVSISYLSVKYLLFPYVQQGVSVFLSAQHYSWVQKLVLNLKWFESFCYFLTVVVTVITISLSFKSVNFNSSSSNHTLVLVIVLLILVW